MAFKVIDLFSGIGGFSLGLESTGYFETVAFCEIEEFPRKVLKKHWSDVPIYEDVKNVTKERLRTDGVISERDRIVVTGGFPCQDLSVAGHQKGIKGERSGLWGELHRLIGEIRPDYAIIENVPNLLSGDRGRWFSRILTDMAEIGFNVRWYSISAGQLGAPHRRNRVWVLAYPNDNTNQTDSRKTREKEKIQGECREEGLSRQSGRTSNDTEILADSDNTRNRTSKRSLDKNREKVDERWEGQPQFELSRQSKNVANSDSRLCGRGGTIGQSGDDKERRLYSEKEEQATHDLRSKTIGCDTVRGKTEDVADSESIRSGKSRDFDKKKRIETSDATQSNSSSSDVANSDSKRGCLWKTDRQNAKDVGESSRRKIGGSRNIKRNLGGVADGLSDRLDGHPGFLIEPDIPRVATGQKDRVKKLKALGNSILPQIAKLLGETIIRHENVHNRFD